MEDRAKGGRPPSGAWKEFQGLGLSQAGVADALEVTQKAVSDAANGFIVASGSLDVIRAYLAGYRDRASGSLEGPRGLWPEVYEPKRSGGLR